MIIRKNYSLNFKLSLIFKGELQSRNIWMELLLRLGSSKEESLTILAQDATER
jgi:hypothetical protein